MGQSIHVENGSATAKTRERDENKQPKKIACNGRSQTICANLYTFSNLIILMGTVFSAA